MGIGDLLAQFPAVKPAELEITTQALPDGLAVRVRHLPTGLTKGVVHLTPDSFDAGLRAVVLAVLTEVSG